MNVFITGGTSGIGLELGKLYLKDGHNVGACSIETLDSAQKLIPSDFHYFHADVRKKDEVQKAVKEFTTLMGSLDIVIACAGINHPKGKIPDFEISRNVVDINIHGVLNTFEIAIQIMKDQGSGHLVSMSSVSGLNGLPGMSVYGATKSFIKSLLETYSIDLKEFGINTTCFAPGFIFTNLTKDNKHKMPFLLKQETAAKLMYKQIAKKKSFHILPFPMIIISKILSLIPRNLYIHIMRLDLLGLSKRD